MINNSIILYLYLNLKIVDNTSKKIVYLIHSVEPVDEMVPDPGFVEGEVGQQVRGGGGGLA